MWIEINTTTDSPFSADVTSLAEVWIEIFLQYQSLHLHSSLPLRKCGLKFCNPVSFYLWISVTSLAEVWIEILLAIPSLNVSPVTSLAEVWIEII